MRRFLLAGLAAVTAAGLPAVAADQPDRPLLGRLNPFAAAEAGPRVRPPVAPLSEEMMLAALRAENEAFTRRMEVCHRLREIAFQTNDEELEGKVNELEKQASATYYARVARLGAKPVGPLPPLPPSDPAAATAALDKALGTGAAVTPLTPKAKPTASATARANQFKEVAP
jgi:hypothetical protein